MPKPGPKTTARYSEKFRATAVRLSQMKEAQVQEVAEVFQGYRSGRGRDRC